VLLFAGRQFSFPVGLFPRLVKAFDCLIQMFDQFPLLGRDGAGSLFLVKLGQLRFQFGPALFGRGTANKLALGGGMFFTQGHDFCLLFGGKLAGFLPPLNGRPVCEAVLISPLFDFRLSLLGREMLQLFTEGYAGRRAGRAIRFVSCPEGGWFSCQGKPDKKAEKH